jgi:hypothetical protein
MNNHTGLPVGDAELDLLTPNERIQRKKARERVAFWAIPRSPVRTPAEGKRAVEKKRWTEAYKLAAAEEERQHNFGRYSGGKNVLTNIAQALFLKARLFTFSTRSMSFK